MGKNEPLGFGEIGKKPFCGKKSKIVHNVFPQNCKNPFLTFFSILKKTTSRRKLIQKF